MDIQPDGCPWGLEPGWSLAEEPVWQDGEWDSVISELLCDSGEGSVAEVQDVGLGIGPGAYGAGQPDGVDPSATAVSDGSSAGGGDCWRSSIAGGGSPVRDVLNIDGEGGGVKAAIAETFPYAVPQHGSLFPPSLPQLAADGVEVGLSNLSPGDHSEPSARSAAEIEDFVVKRKRSSIGSDPLPPAAAKICRRAYQEESVGGTESQACRSVRFNDAGDVEAGAGTMDELVSDTAATTPDSGDDEAQRKRQLRLMRNRESASQSRSRKKCYLKELEMKCRYLEGHCTKLEHAVHHTTMENLALREELERAKKSNGKISSEAEPAALESDSLPSESLPRRTYPFLTASLLLCCLIVGLCHESAGRVFLAMLLRAAPRVSRGENDRVQFFPNLGGAGVGRNQLYRPRRGRLASAPRHKKRRRRKGIFRTRSITGATSGATSGGNNALWLQRAYFASLGVEDVVEEPAVTKAKQLRNSSMFRCRVKSCRSKR